MAWTPTHPTTHGFRRSRGLPPRGPPRGARGGWTDLAVHPHAERVEQGVLVYEAAAIRPLLADWEARADALRAEIADALADGPGIVVVTGAVEHDVVDRATSAFESWSSPRRRPRAGWPVMTSATPGSNDRVWNALEKLAVADPEAFVAYYANDVVALAASAWLGPGYQVTSQVNVVNPGGQGQTVHRDYHLGFQSPEVKGSYPGRVHDVSPLLTLQGRSALRHARRVRPDATCRTARSTPTATSRTG